MASSFGTDQGDSSFFMSSDGDEHQPQPEQGAGFILASNDDDGFVDQQSEEHEDSISIADEDDWDPEQADLFTEYFTEAIRSFTPDGFTSHAGADDTVADTAATYSEYYYLGGEDVSTPRGSTFPIGFDHYAVDEDDDEDELYTFVVEAPVAAASEAAIAAALEAAEAPADDCCPVCLQDEDDGEAAKWSRVAACGHRFHSACAEKWLRVKPTCPVCRCSTAGSGADDAAGSPLPSAVIEELMALGYEVADVTLLLVNVPEFDHEQGR